MGKFGDRMKDYENAYRIHLPKRMPVILRIDGTHFHSYTRGMKKPFDEDLVSAFWETCKYLAENIMGCKIVYHQSDEISLLLTNYDKLTTQSWFENNLQKLVSVSASMTTAKFNEIMRTKYPDKSLATFDSRAWVLPQDEVCNYFLWRQQDATKNSISMVAQANFPHKQLQGLNGDQMQDKLMLEKNVNWNDLPVWQKRGVCITKQYYNKGEALRSKWDIDQETPVFSQSRDYIEQYVYLD
jgi:tRNA(His) 5'-end guanylyltransferase